MLPNDTRCKIENITTGTLLEGQSDHCTAARNFLCGRYPTSTTVKTDFESKAIVKKEQAKTLEEFCTLHHLWIPGLPDEKCTLPAAAKLVFIWIQAAGMLLNVMMLYIMPLGWNF